jgi:hypothetical protein
VSNSRLKLQLLYVIEQCVQQLQPLGSVPLQVRECPYITIPAHSYMLESDYGRHVCSRSCPVCAV